MKNDKRRKDNLCWLVECKFRKGTEWAEMDGDDWGPYSGGCVSKNAAVQECRFERSQLRKEGRFKDAKFRATGVTEEEYALLFPLANPNKSESA